MSDDPDVLYLSPRCHDTGEGREWCADDVWRPCEECGAPSVKYVRADTLDARDAEIARLRGVLERIARTSEGGASDQHAPDMWEACRTWACDALNGGDNEG